MGKVFYFGDAWVKHALDVRKRGLDREGAEEMPLDEHGMRRDAAIGLEAEDVHYRGDRVVVEVDAVDKATGDHIQVFHRYDDAGKFIGTYEARWEKSADRQHALARTRRVFY